MGGTIHSEYTHTMLLVYDVAVVHTANTFPNIAR